MFRLVGAIVAVVLMSITSSLVSTPATADDYAPIVPRGKGDMCVAPTQDMRENHMDYLMHQRDETVIDGIRGKPFSLTDCVNCHAQVDGNGEAIRIDAPGQFCQSCHTFAAVKIDCFSCHRAIPDDPLSTASLEKMPASHHAMLLVSGGWSAGSNEALTPDSLDALRYVPDTVDKP